MGKKLSQIFRFWVPKKFFKNILKVLKRIKKRFFAKMGKNVSFKKKWVKNLVQFPGSEKIFKNMVRLG